MHRGLGVGNRKRETRRAIRDAALDLALENGLENLTVEAIAQAAGVSPRTVFNYFDSKEDALVTQAAEGADEVCKLLLERPSQEPPLKRFAMLLYIATISVQIRRIVNGCWLGSGSLRIIRH